MRCVTAPIRRAEPPGVVVTNENRSTGSRQAEKGYRGARLGEPYIYRWVDQEPSTQTWQGLAKKQGCLLAAIGLPVCWTAAWMLGGEGLFSIAVLLSAYIGMMLYGVGYEHAKRTDEEPVPKAVRREAYIEYAEGDFYFGLFVEKGG